MRHRPIAPLLRALLCMDGAGQDELASLAFDSAAAAAWKGARVPGYYPGGGGPSGAWADVHPWRKADLRPLSAGTLAAVSELAWRVYKIQEGKPYPRPALAVQWDRAAVRRRIK